MQSFAFKKDITSSASAHSQLSENLSLDKDHALLSYHTEFSGTDLDAIKSQMRKVTPEFSNEPNLMKDV